MSRTGLKIHFTRIYHEYFYKEEVGAFSEQSTPGVLESLNVIDCLIFDIGVHSYSNTNRIINFRGNIKQPNKKLEAEQLLTDRVEFMWNY